MLISDILIVSQSVPTCEDQVYGETMCDDCLAIRRRYYCASYLPKCIDEDNEIIGVCKGLCEDVNRRCSSDLDCEDLPDSECSPASFVSGRGTWFSAVGLLLFTWR